MLSGKQCLLSTGHERTHVKREQSADQRIGYIALDDTLSESFCNGGFANTGWSDEHWVVFGAPTENMNRTADLVVTTDDRVELALLSGCGEILSISF